MVRDRVPLQRADGRRVGVADPVEGDHLREGRVVGQGRGLQLDELAVGAGERRTVWAALLIRMSSGPAAATSSASETTWVGSRRSIPTILSRWIQSALSSSAAKRRTASFGNRVVIVVRAVASRRSAMYARLPVRSARWSRLPCENAAQDGQSQW